MKPTDKVYYPLLFSMVALLGMVIGMRLHESLISDDLIASAQISPERSIDEAINHIKEKYYGSVDYDKMTDEVLGEMLDQLDPFSSYFKIEMDQRFNHFINGTYEGLGFEFFELRDTIYITKIIDPSPASRNGLRVGDILLSIDSSIVTGVEISRDSIYKLSSKAIGQMIKLGIYRSLDGDKESIDLEITQVKSPLVKSSRLNDTDILYIRIERFAKGTFTSFMDELDRYKKENIDIRHIIIDLRDNPGGLLNETIKLLNQLILEPEQILTSTINNKNRVTEYKSNGRGFLDIDRIVVLINGNSASASEIIAGALQDHDRAVIIGQESYGKGLIQQNYDLKNKASINITVGEYLLPTGRKIYKDPLRKDSVNMDVESLRLKRKLTSNKGVVPDIVMNGACPPLNNRQILRQLYRELIERDLLTDTAILLDSREVVESLVRNIYKEVEGGKACEGAVLNQIRWVVWEYLDAKPGWFKRDHADDWIQKSIQALEQIDFDRVLAGSIL